MVTPAEVLRLEAAYYAAVVLLEVPSGYFSDRVGRRPTLVFSGLCWTAACVLFASTSGFAPFLLAQVLLAAGMAFQSGTDSSLLYDSLKYLGEEDQLRSQEARAESWSNVSRGAAALIGGLVAAFDLRIAYVLTAVTAGLATLLALGFVEPPGRRRAPDMRQQAGTIALLLRKPALRWLLAAAVGLIIFVHVPYELGQPWLELLLSGQDRPGFAATPPVAGALTAGAMLVAAWAARRSDAVATRLGGPATLVLALAAMALAPLLLAWAVHPLVALALVLRGAPQALAGPALLGEVHPKVPSSARATWLSVQSLAGRLAFSVTLAVASLATAGDALSHGEIRTIALGYVALLVVWVAGLGLTRRSVQAR